MSDEETNHIPKAALFHVMPDSEWDKYENAVDKEMFPNESKFQFWRRVV